MFGRIYCSEHLLGQICWSDQLVGSGKSDLWFTSCLVISVVQIIYWVRSAGQIKSPSVRFAYLIRVSRTCGSDRIWSDRLFRSYIGSGLLVKSACQICGSEFGWICGSDDIVGQICWLDQFSSGTLESSQQVGSAGQLTLCRICLSDQVKSNLWFRPY